MKALALILTLISLSACSVVGPGQRGIRISLGKVSEDVKPPGAYFWVPFVFGMTSMNIQTQASEVKASAASKDMQEITTTVVVNWAIAPEKAVDIYRAIGTEDDVLYRIIGPAINESMKSATAKKTAEEILTKRAELKTEIDSSLRERLSKYGVTVTDVSVTNLTFSKEFTDAIERKQIAEQEAKQSEYDAQKAIQQAKAEVNRAKGQAEAQALLKSTMTTEILQQRAIEKWDGHFPQVMGSQAVPFINFSKEQQR